MRESDSASLLELERKSKRSLSRAILLLVGIPVLVIGAVTGAYFLLRAGPCERVAGGICGMAGMAECPLVDAVKRADLPSAQCEQVEPSLAAVTQMPPAMRSAAAVTILQDLFLGAARAEQVRAAVRAVEEQRGPDRSVRPDLIRAAAAFGPSCCIVLLSRMQTSPDPAVREALHGALVMLAGGLDQGVSPDAWQPWCAAQYTTPQAAN
jgi:hypothetical protein